MSYLGREDGLFNIYMVGNLKGRLWIINKFFKVQALLPNYITLFLHYYTTVQWYILVEEIATSLLFSMCMHEQSTPLLQNDFPVGKYMTVLQKSGKISHSWRIQHPLPPGTLQLLCHFSSCSSTYLYKQSASPIGIFEQNQNMFWYWDTSQLH